MLPREVEMRSERTLSWGVKHQALRVVQLDAVVRQIYLWTLLELLTFKQYLFILYMQVMLVCT